jgi:hypothetical protein
VVKIAHVKPVFLVVHERGLWTTNEPNDYEPAKTRIGELLMITITIPEEAITDAITDYLQTTLDWSDYINTDEEFDNWCDREVDVDDQCHQYLQNNMPSDAKIEQWAKEVAQDAIVTYDQLSEQQQQLNTFSQEVNKTGEAIATNTQDIIMLLNRLEKQQIAIETLMEITYKKPWWKFW